MCTPNGTSIRDGRISDGSLSYYESHANHANHASTANLIDILEEVKQARIEGRLQ
jgi:hypothetical protein